VSTLSNLRFAVIVVADIVGDGVGPPVGTGVAVGVGVGAGVGVESMVGTYQVRLRVP
jgi:hypothetical protein